MAEHLRKQEFSLVLTSPRQRAHETCGITGYGEVAQVDPDLSECDYGEYEGRTTADIRKAQPGWTI
jgi:broad specificity phosphatase PhoE